MYCATILGMTEDSTSVFTARLLSEWLPNYCNDRGYAIEGYKAASNKVTADDARGFIRALDGRIVEDCGGGRYQMPNSKAKEVIFWEGAKGSVPRSITLWLEPVITIASVARLHFDLGWPLACLGMQSVNYEFDLTASLPGKLETEHIAGEVKKSERELDALIKAMIELGSRTEVDETALPAPQLNAYRKLKGLLVRRAPLFWAVGPGGRSHAFAVSYPAESKASFSAVSLERLVYPGVGNASS